MALLFDSGIFSVNDTDGAVGVGWKLNFYTTGTSSRRDTFPTEADALAGTNANTNPVISVATGRFPAIWLADSGYKVVLADAADVVKTTRDPAMSYAEGPSYTPPAGLFNTVIHKGYNPGSLTSWTHTTAPYSYEGMSIDLGGYGPRQFGSYGTPTALNGSINIPDTATIANHGTGVSGYVKNASTTTGGVALFGEANRTAASALIWGLNTRTQDGGFGGLNVWGYEMDMNIDNVTTTAVGFDAVGGSTVEPTLSIAYQVQAIGVFAATKKRWQYGFRSRDAGAIVGIELGAVMDAANSGSQSFLMNYRNGANAVVQALSIQVSSAGDASIIGGVASSTLLALKTPGSTQNNIALLGDAVGFFGTAPVNKPTGVAVTAAGVHAALVTLGLIAA